MLIEGRGVPQDEVQFPIVPEVDPHGTQIEVVNLYVTVDTTYFTPLDMDPSTGGIQPFTAGTKDSRSSLAWSVSFDSTWKIIACPWGTDCMRFILCEYQSPGTRWP